MIHNPSFLNFHATSLMCRHHLYLPPLILTLLPAKVEAVARCEDHPNVLGLIGVCEERDALFVVLRGEGATTLKQTLLDSRALLHFPAYAQKNQRATTLREETVADAMVGVARGMRRLEELGVRRGVISIINLSYKFGGILIRLCMS